MNSKCPLYRDLKWFFLICNLYLCILSINVFLHKIPSWSFLPSGLTSSVVLYSRKWVPWERFIFFFSLHFSSDISEMHASDCTKVQGRERVSFLKQFKRITESWEPRSSLQVLASLSLILMKFNYVSLKYISLQTSRNTLPLCPSVQLDFQYLLSLLTLSSRYTVDPLRKEAAWTHLHYIQKEKELIL